MQTLIEVAISTAFSFSFFSLISNWPQEERKERLEAIGIAFTSPTLSFLGSRGI